MKKWLYCIYFSDAVTDLIGIDPEYIHYCHYNSEINEEPDDIFIDATSDYCLYHCQEQGEYYIFTDKKYGNSFPKQLTDEFKLYGQIKEIK